MIVFPLTNNYSALSYEFNRLRMRALKASLLARISGKNAMLKTLSEVSQSSFRNARNKGVQNISIDKITGTVNRSDDFDMDFRPRKKHLGPRWVNVFLLLNSDGWSPIVVHKVGDEYYVEDGHHRVSVARLVGMLFIEAEVWDHSSQTAQSVCSTSTRLSSSSSVKACAAD